MISWTTVENAIVTWLLDATGLASGQVIWADQDGLRPDVSYISVTEIALERVGQDWLNVEDNPAPSAGEEIIHKSRGVRRWTIGLQCFGGAAVGDSTPRSLLELARANANLPTRRDELHTAGIGLASFADILSISGPLGTTKFEPRASMDVVSFLAQEVEETGTNIEIVAIDNLITGETFTVP